MESDLSPIYCLPLDSPDATLTLVGGKGKSLAHLAHAGFNVPSGFHITTAAYGDFLTANHLYEQILRQAHAITDDPKQSEQAAAFIQNLFQTGEIPAEISRAVLQAYTALGGRPIAVAVRSSATAEDLPGLSFAGQQETYLNIQGEEALLNAVRRCWASLWSPRAIHYRNQMKVEHRGVAMGVVVQIMVPAEVSGVLFTAHPATGSREELLVNASYGLGEAIVSNTVTPDAYRINRIHQSVLEKNIGQKTVMSVAGEAGVVTREVDKARRGQSSLTEGQLRELVAVGLKIETLFEGHPQDIEWSYAHNDLFILQARPITGLPQVPAPPTKWEPPIQGSKWIRRQIAENMPDPLSPLFDDLYVREGLDISMDAMQHFMGSPRALDKLYNRPIYGSVNGYAFMRADMNFTPMMIPLVFGAMAVGVTSMLRGSGNRYWEHSLAEYQAKVADWRLIDPYSLSNAQLYELLRQMAYADAIYWFGATMAFGTAKSTEGILDWFLKIFVPGKKLSTGMFLRGFPSKTLEAQAALEALAGQIRADEGLSQLVLTNRPESLLAALMASPAAGPVVQSIQRYFADFGHQTYSIDFAEPVLAETPASVMASLQSLVREPAQHHLSQPETLVRQREALVAEMMHSFDPLRRWLFKKLLGQALRYGPIREESLYFVGYAWPKLRQCALVLGQRLVDSGVLAEPGDIYFLTGAELGEVAGGSSSSAPRPDLINQTQYRRALREARKQLHPPAAVPESYSFKLGVIDLSSRESQVRGKSSGSELVGFAVSPGQVTAPACVILSPSDFPKMRTGCILVCATTTPAWTPLFSQAVGLVTDIGGILAHGSIVAREFGLPAVMGTGNATRRIRDGQLITVDGTLGKVSLHTAEEKSS